jgi:hypothetical protein
VKMQEITVERMWLFARRRKLMVNNRGKTWGGGHMYGFWARSQNCEKGLLASLCLSVRPSASPHGTTRLPLDRFSRDLIFEDLSKIC